jgi:predicted transcriptional regulator of viral defense system
MERSAEYRNLKEELGSGISLLDPLKANQGKISSNFGLKINMAPKLIRQKVLN